VLRKKVGEMGKRAIGSYGERCTVEENLIVLFTHFFSLFLGADGAPYTVH
jgi:hypothetical protein